MDWLKNLSDAIDYIEDNLDGEISYDQCANIACCSTFYFQRMFSYIAGISLSEYIRRRKMTQAGFELQRTNKKIIDIALKYGYSSPTSFTRAFKGVNNITPSSAKKKGAVLNAYPRIKLSINIMGDEPMPYYIKEKKRIRIVGIRIPLIEDMDSNQKKVPLFWEETLKSGIFEEICSLNNKEPKGIFGVSVYKNPKDIHYYIGVPTDKPIPTGMYECFIPESNWAIFENESNLKKDIQKVFRRFYTEWLPFSGYEYGWLPDVEVYPILKNSSMTGHSEVWISINKKES